MYINSGVHSLGENLMSNLKKLNASLSYLKQYGEKSAQHADNAINMTALHALEHGDWSGVNKLFAIITNYKSGIVSVRQVERKVKAVFCGTIKREKETGVWVRTNKKKPIEINVPALDVPYWEDQEEKQVTFNYDSQVQFDKLIAKALQAEEKAIEKGAKITGDKKARDNRIAMLKALISDPEFSELIKLAA
tara:strand:- start:383 stop:958 length:576 start_codon:yes stop_codon:yes gene_type:complete